VNPVFRLAYLAVWGAAVACWWWLHREARDRSRLLSLLGDRHGGFVRTSFSWLTLTREAHEVEFVRMLGKVPCRFRLRYGLPLNRPGRPWTALEFELPEPVMGDVPGGYSVADLANGRGAFVAGVNATALIRKYVAELPAGTAPALSWHGAVLCVRFPFLMDYRQEVWVEHAIEFLSAMAKAVIAGGSDQ